MDNCTLGELTAAPGTPLGELTAAPISCLPAAYANAPASLRATSRAAPTPMGHCLIEAGDGECQVFWTFHARPARHLVVFLFEAALHEVGEERHDATKKATA